jgi:two-component system LytT family response regulator
MMKVIIVEDDPLAIEIIETLIKKNFNSVEIMGIALSVDQALKLINKNKPDILLMDIDLGDHDSFKLFEYLDPENLNIVFTTSYKEFAIKAIQNNALGYILKPFEEDEFNRVLEKAIKRVEMKNALKGKEISVVSNVRKIMLLEKNKLWPITVDDIIKVRANGAYAEVYLNGGKIITSSRNLGAFEKILSNGFIRIHSSCLINPKHIYTYEGGMVGIVTMSDKSEEIVSRQRRKEFMRHFQV